MSLSRRHLVLLSSAALLGCEEKKLPGHGCATPIDEASKEQRQTLGYREKSPREDQRCDTCTKYVANQFQACGGCLLFSGPVAPAGYCKSWVATPLKKAAPPAAKKPRPNAPKPAGSASSEPTE